MSVVNQPRLNAASIAIIFGLAGCGESTETLTDASDVGNEPLPSIQVLKSTLSRDLEPNIDIDQQLLFIDGNTHFAIDIHQLISADAGNVVHSPHSMLMALSMLYAGAQNDTATQIADALHFAVPESEIHQAFNWLSLELSRPEPEAEDAPPLLTVANDIWPVSGLNVEDNFLDTLAVNYGAEVRALDFLNSPNGSREVINKHIEDLTRENIKDLFPEGSIASDTLLVLSNAVYFNAKWVQPFRRTLDQPFTTEEMREVRVPTMNNEASQYGYYRSDSLGGVSAVELEYADSPFSMVLIRPDQNLAEFEQRLDTSILSEITSSFTPTLVNLYLPEFKISWGQSLKDKLQALGMNDVFSGANADLRNITGSSNLYVGDVFHKGFIRVHEEGTEAAAATGLIIFPVSAPPPPEIEVRFNKPFLYIIRHQPTGAILFMGRVADPS